MAKRSGLGRGIGALIPVSDEKERPVDVFFPDNGSVASSSANSLEVDTRTTKNASAKANVRGAESTLASVPGLTLAHIPLDDIVPNRAQPRQIFRDDDLAELVHSIREF